MIFSNLKVIFLCILLKNLLNVFGLDNGLALTPPMGWLAWERFQCTIRCDIDPINCIREELFMEMADRLIKDGFKDAGYNYVNIDDCWMNPIRSSDGNLYPDIQRFPRGIKFLSSYMHARGLKLGIYQTFGLKTCMGFPGIVGHMKQDADMFASWEIDMVKLDGCFTHPLKMDKGYIEFGEFLNQTNRPMVYSCSWPYYQLIADMEPAYERIAQHCNLWRNYHDIKDSWRSIEMIIDFFGDNQEVLSKHTGPGHWNDPDMLLIGNFHLNAGQSRAQMAVWCILPAPLLMSNDLRNMNPVFRKILTDKTAIAINQDRLGLPGKRIYKKNYFEVWKRPISPVRGDKTSYALLFLNRQSKKRFVKFPLSEFDLNSSDGYSITQAFNVTDFGILFPNSTINFVVHALDVVFLNFKIIVN